MKVPFLDLQAQYRSLRPEMDDAIASVLATGEFVGGAALRRFEKAFAAAHDAKHCIGVANGTDALVVILRSLGLAAGDVVATAANSFIASSEAITLAGGRPLFVDCGDDFTMSVSDLASALEAGERGGRPIRAIIPVHLYGRACEMAEIGRLAARYGCKVIEDCAQAHLGQQDGRSIGSFGNAAAFSFYPGKNLGAYGDAGAILTNDDALAERMRMFANHGRKDKYDHEFEGTNSRLDNLQAAILEVKLPRLRQWTAARIRAADRYRERLADVPGLHVPAAVSGFGHVYHLFVVRLRDRERVRRALAENGIATGVHYPSALPDLGAYRHLERRPTPNASSFAQEILSLPIFPEITDEQIDLVCTALRRELTR